ncbi:hypothetical protein Hanom_Chr04g00328561 [Helianthus anomalus]
MNCTGRSLIRSILVARDLESFVEAYNIPERFSPTLPGPDDSAECTPDRIVIYTLSFSSCGVHYPLSTFKMGLLQHFRVHFSQLHPLGFMSVMHFELSCVAVSGEPSIPFCMFYKLISDRDSFTFAKRKDNISPHCYSFMPTSTYPNEWKSWFIFVSGAMILESPPLRDAKVVNEDIILVLSADEIVQWKCMHENPTRAFTFPEGVLAMGGLSPFHPVRPKAFLGKKEITLWSLLHGDCKDVKFMVGDKVGPSMSQGVEKKVPEGSVQAGDSAAGEKDEEAFSSEKEGPPGSLQVKGSSDDDDDEDLESRLVRKGKAAQSSNPKQALVPRNVRLRLRSPSGQKAFQAIKATSELPPTGVKGSLSKHLRSSSLMSKPLLRSSNPPIEIPTAPSSFRVQDKTPEISAACITLAFEVSPLHATVTSKPSHLEGFVSQSPLAPLFADALSVPYIPR